MNLLLAALALAGSLSVGGCTSCPTAGIEGVLETREDRLGIGSGETWSPIHVREGLFAYGIRRDERGFAITDFIGNVIAREGDRIRATGGGDSDVYLCSDIRVVASRADAEASLSRWQRPAGARLDLLGRRNGHPARDAVHRRPVSAAAARLTARARLKGRPVTHRPRRYKPDSRHRGAPLRAIGCLYFRQPPLRAVGDPGSAPRSLPGAQRGGEDRSHR